LRMESEITRLIRTGKKVFGRHKKEIEDIIVFGSMMKGEEMPTDIDVLLVFREKVDKAIENEFREEAGIQNIDANSVSSKELEGDGFIAKEGLYLEGKSLVTGKRLSDSLGFFSACLITYDLTQIKGSLRTRFYYALQGRGTDIGFLGSVGAKRFSDNVIICDYSIVDKVTPFFEHWKVPHKSIPVLIPSRLKKVVMG